MKRTMKRLFTGVTVGGLALSAGFAPSANAACGIPAWNMYELGAQWAPSVTPAPFRAMTAFAQGADQPQPGGASIVGMWRFQFIAKNSPPIPDGTIIDAGFSQWHSDGTEITNSSKPPATGNFCLGVWKKTGPSTFELHHKALDFRSDGSLIGEVTIREEVTVDRSGARFTGTFTIDSFNTAGALIGHVAGDITAERITVD